MATTNDVEKMMRTAQRVTDAGRESYEALVENAADFQRRSVGLAQDGLKFWKLQEDSVRAAQQWWASGVRLLELQQRNAGFVQDWLKEASESFQAQAEQNRRAAETVARSVRAQQEGFRTLADAWTGAFVSPFTYAQEGLRTVQQATERSIEATQEVTQQGLRLAEQTTEQTERTLRQVERATRQAELEAEVFAALGTEDYDELTVGDISKKLGDLSTEELRKVREYEKQNKDRETLIEQIDRKIKSSS